MKWEYKVIEVAFRSPADAERQLTGLGEMGWELIEFIRSAGPKGHWYLFKRPA